jgi:hypothetical protein
MPVIPKVPTELKLDYFIQFTLQRRIGEAFDAYCKSKNMSKQAMLRILVAEELVSEPVKEVPRPAEQV